MTLQRRLTIAFIGIAIVVLSIFGFVAYYIATEFATEEEIDLLEVVAKEKAATFAGQSAQEAKITLARQDTHRNYPIILLDAANTVIAATPEARAFIASHMQAYFSRQPARKDGGSLKLANTELIWGMAPVPETPYRLVLFHPADDDLTFFQALGVKLLISGILIIWVTTWAALILASMISRRLDVQNAILVHQSLHDHLTDLPNRTLLFDRMQQAIYYYRREGMPVALFLIELNHFKEINDTLGHRSGDAVLKLIGPRLQETLWEPDTIARLDGGEFAVLLPKVNQESAALVANKIINSLQRPVIVEDLEIEVGACIGIALYPDHGDDPDSLFRQADVAMCLAKKTHHDFLIYTPESDPHSIEQLTLMTDLRQAISNNELELYYQPKIDIRTQQVVGVEALLRWFHPQRGLIPPDDFIPKAEQTGLIKPLTKWVIERAFKQSRDWNKQGINLHIAINVSQRSLYDRELINQLADTMQKFSVMHCTLDIEITETAIMAQPEQSLITLHELHTMGVNLSIDDFGTGFTSLSYLKELPVDELKIDKSFVMSMLKDGKDIMIVRSIIQLAHSLGRVVVAEGVESKEILDLLYTLDCDTAQGFYMSKPLPVNEFEQWLKSSGWKHADDESKIG